MQVPVILVSGISADAMAVTTVGLQWDLPRAVVVRHEIDYERSVLLRLISDASGVLEREELDIAHACVSCAIREDIIPTLERLGEHGAWGAIIAHLPVTAEATQVCRVLGMDTDIAPHVRISASVVALEAASIVDDLLGDELVVERDLGASESDERSIAEVACAMVEYADLIMLDGALSKPARELLVALARPNAIAAEDPADVETAALVSGIHNHSESEQWVAPVPLTRAVGAELEDVWVLDFKSHLPFHPDRLNAAIERLGTGQRRSRGCFWLPTRPHQICIWDGAGGQLSIGSAPQVWGKKRPRTHIVITGVGGGRDRVERDFRDCLLTREEVATMGVNWPVAEDGFEPWLG
ncbi:MAG: GTP-binding protein [Candidatus Nanopelagicales bacterium]